MILGAPTGLLAAPHTWVSAVSGHRLRTEGLFLGVTVHVSVVVTTSKQATVLCGTDTG